MMPPRQEQEVEFWVKQEQQWFIGQIELLRNRATRIGDTRTAFVINDLLVRARNRAKGEDPAQPTKQLKRKKK